MKNYLKYLSISLLGILISCHKDPENLHLKPLNGIWSIKSYKIDGVDSLVVSDSTKYSMFLGVTCPNCNQTGGEGYYIYDYVSLTIYSKNYFHISKEFTHNLRNKIEIADNKKILIGIFFSEKLKCGNDTNICTQTELNNFFLLRSGITKNLYWDFDAHPNSYLTLRTTYKNQKHEILLQ